MPFKMSQASSVMIQQTLYVGGGIARGTSANTIMVYNTISGRWNTLPSYTYCYFTMAAMSNQLLLVGGYEQEESRILGVWDSSRQAWTHPYPEMPTARASCSAVAHNEWLVVAGGWIVRNNYESMSCVEVLNINSKQWYSGSPTPRPWSHMHVAMVGCVAYFMGGTDTLTSSIQEVYSADIPLLITCKASTGIDGRIWKVISGFQLKRSTPFSIRGSLLAFGGRDEHDKAVTTINLYQPESGEWVKVGDLQSPRSYSTCAMTTDREIMVAGGHYEKTVEFAQLVQ